MDEHSETSGTRQDRLAEIYDEWRAEFLDGYMDDDEERHCLNVGRVALEFARLEEQIGRLVFDLDEDRRDTGTEYMRYIKYSRDIAGHLSRTARSHPDLEIDLRRVASLYREFASKRNRYAHASVGAVTVIDPKTRAMEIREMQELHAQSGAFADVPTDEEIQVLCLRMRQVSLDLLETLFRRSTERSARIFAQAIKTKFPDREIVRRRLVQYMARTLGPVAERMNLRVQEAARSSHVAESHAMRRRD